MKLRKHNTQDSVIKAQTHLISCVHRDHNLLSVSEMLDVSMFPSDSFVTDNLIGRISIPLLSSVCNIIVRSNSKFHILLKLK